MVSNNSGVSKYKNKSERLEIVLDLCKKLRKFPTAPHPIYQVDNSYLNLYDTDYPAIIKIKEIFNMYVKQNDNDLSSLTGFSGTIKFEEFDKIIEYRLPIKKHTNPLFKFVSL